MVEAGYDAITDRYVNWSLRIAEWLRPEGLFLASLGCRGSDSVEADWLGVPMYFSSHDASTNRELLQNAGFTLLVDELVTMHEPEGPATFHWVMARTATSI
nr:hypothetical protein GCM10020241_01220 [Streptoalloteichus tenebrarius]